MDFQERLAAFAMLGATWVMWLLVGISVIALAIILERAYYFFATNEEFSKLLGSLLGKLKDNDVDGAKSAMRASQTRRIASPICSRSFACNSGSNSRTRRAASSRFDPAVVTSSSKRSAEVGTADIGLTPR